MRNYVMVCFLSKSPPATFSSNGWPLHVTILRPFMSENSPEEFAHKLEPICNRAPVQALTAKAQELFGPNHDIPVIELELTPELALLQRQVLEVCESWITFKSPSFPTFRPHVTLQKEGRVHVGDKISLDSLSIVEQGNPYRVTCTLKLQGD